MKLVMSAFRLTKYQPMAPDGMTAALFQKLSVHFQALGRKSIQWLLARGAVHRVPDAFDSQLQASANVLTISY